MQYLKNLATAFGWFVSVQAVAQACEPTEWADIYADDLELTWTPDNPIGSTEYVLYHANGGPNINSNTHAVTANLFELDNQLARVRLITSRSTSSPVPVGPPFRFGQGGYVNSISQGKAYEMEILYACDTDFSNNRLVRIAHTANPVYVVFRDGMEGPSHPPPHPVPD